MTSQIFVNLCFIAEYCTCVFTCWGDMRGKGCIYKTKRVFMVLRAPVSKRGKSLSELPSSGGMRSKLAARRRGYLCSKMLNVLFHMRWDELGYDCFDLAAHSLGIHIKALVLLFFKCRIQFFMYEQMNKLRHLSCWNNKLCLWSFFLLQSEMNGYIRAGCVSECVCACSLSHILMHTHRAGHTHEYFELFFSVPVAAHSETANQSL